MGRSFEYQQPDPTRRPLKVFAFDPMLGRRPGGRITIDIPNETDLQPGPRGSRIEVIDYDGANHRFYTPVNLNDKAILMQNGLEPTESDPRFHQQMVYTVAMKVLENFDTALGRKLRFRSNRRLRLFPHAFQGANAFYEPRLLAILFGYFRADKKNPGPNLPGQNVFTCLSHDIIAHEMTHALVDRMRYYFREPSNNDVLAFHEGFADIVAIFQHFSFPAILRDHIQVTRGDLHSPNNLIQLASEFGYATGKGQALRSALDKASANGDKLRPDPKLYQTLFEPHERGSILVAAVFDAFFKTYQDRIEDLIRIATGGTGELPKGDLHPDLVNRIANEASRTAQSILRMCIRAFDYLPPVDVTFGDYLRAMITADYELAPEDEIGQRAAMIDSFRERGVYPYGVTSLADEDENYVPFRDEWVLDADEFNAAWGVLTPNEIKKLKNVGDGSEFGVAVKLEEAVNGTSLMLMLQIGKAFLLFPGDAQWGTWQCARNDSEWFRLLEKTNFYKVGHHGSHNATPKEFVTDILKENFLAMVPVRPIKKFKRIPRVPLMEALRNKPGKVVRSDIPDPVDPPEFKRVNDIYVELQIPI